MCAKGSQRRKDTPCRRIDNNDNDDKVFQGSVLLWVFVAVVIVVHVAVYLHDNLFVCLLCYLLVSIGRSVNQPIAALSCCMTPAGAGSECAVPDLSKYCQRFNKCCIHRGGSLSIAKPEQQGGTR